MTQILQAILDFFSFIGSLFSSAVQGVAAFGKILTFTARFPYFGFLPWWAILIVTIVSVSCLIKLLISILVDV